VSIIKEYGKWSLYLMFKIFCYYLHLMENFEIGCANKKANANSNLFLAQVSKKTCH
jgi:hypothetical protein